MKRFTSWLRRLLIRDHSITPDSIRMDSEKASHEGAMGFNPMEDDFYRYLQSEADRSEENVRKFRRGDWLDEPLSLRFIGDREEGEAKG